jgi:hypothetical protein
MGTLSLLSILHELNETDGRRKLERRETIFRRLIRDRPDILEGFRGELGASHEMHRLGASNAPRAFGIGDSKEFRVVGLL